MTRLRRRPLLLAGVAVALLVVLLLGGRRLAQRLRPVQTDELEELARDAVAMTGLDELNLDHRFLIAEWEQVVLARNLETLPDYAMAPRPGRGVRLSRAQRRQVWSAIERLVADLAARKRATYVQLADLAA